MNMVELFKKACDDLNQMTQEEFSKRVDSLDPKDIERWKMPEETFCMRERIRELEEENTNLKKAQQEFIAEFYSGRVKVDRASPEFWRCLQELKRGIEK